GVAKLLEYSGPGYRTRGAYLLSALRVARLAPRTSLHARVRVLHLDRPGETLDLFTKRGAGQSYEVMVDGARQPPYSRSPYGPKR
ncbi:MAG TPA: hypothetical protein VIJ77_03695, partial [Candidatus Tumulicola sp.]